MLRRAVLHPLPLGVVSERVRLQIRGGLQIRVLLFQEGRAQRALTGVQCRKNARSRAHQSASASHRTF